MNGPASRRVNSGVTGSSGFRQLGNRQSCRKKSLVSQNQNFVNQPPAHNVARDTDKASQMNAPAGSFWRKTRKCANAKCTGEVLELSAFQQKSTKNPGRRVTGRRQQIARAGSSRWGAGSAAGFKRNSAFLSPAARDKTQMLFSDAPH